MSDNNTQYQRNKKDSQNKHDILSINKQEAKDYYENNKERLQEQPRNKYRAILDNQVRKGYKKRIWQKSIQEY